MASAIPYDSVEARAVTGAITSLMTGIAYSTSAEMASEQGPFAEYESNKESMFSSKKSDNLLLDNNLSLYL